MLHYWEEFQSLATKWSPNKAEMNRLCALVEDKCLNHINHINPTGYVTHQQFNIQQLYALPTLYLCVLCLSENKQRLVPLTA